MDSMKTGTKIRTLFEHSETGTIVRPRKVNLPLPSADWVIVQLDDGGDRLCMHRDMFVVRNCEHARDSMNASTPT